MNTSKVNATELVKIYVALHPGKEFTNEDVYNWGLDHGYDVTPAVDLKAAALKKIKRAVKQSTVVDAQNRVIPRYIYAGDEEGKLPLWSELAFTPPPVVQRSLDMHRTKSVQTLVQAKMIADSYNDNYNLGQPVQLNLGLEDDVLEQVIIRRNSGKGDKRFWDDDEADDQDESSE